MSQIKQLQPKEGVTLLPIQLAPSITRTEIVDNVLLAYIGDKLHHTYQLPFKCKIIGKATEIPEEVWQGIMPCKKARPLGAESVRPMYYHENGKSYKLFNTATESAMSFLAKHEVYSVNPLGDEPKDRPDLGLYTKIIREKHMMWQQAETNTGTWAILQQIKS